MNLNEFKNKTVDTLEKKYKKSGNLDPVFLYVTKDLQLKAFDLKSFSNKSPEYMALILKQMCRQESPLFTAIVLKGEVATMSFEDEKAPTVENSLVVYFNSVIENKIFLQFKMQEESKQLQLLREDRSNKVKGIFTNLI